MYRIFSYREGESVPDPTTVEREPGDWITDSVPNEPAAQLQAGIWEMLKPPDRSLPVYVGPSPIRGCSRARAGTHTKPEAAEFGSSAPSIGEAQDRRRCRLAAWKTRKQRNDRHLRGRVRARVSATLKGLRLATRDGRTLPDRR